MAAVTYASDDWSVLCQQLVSDLDFQAAWQQKRQPVVESLIVRMGLVRMAGILFARPALKLTQDEVLPNLHYFHIRSGRSISFYCAGYRNKDDEPQSAVVSSVEGREWTFSEKGFDDIRRNVECDSKWRFRGSVELLLINLSYDGFDYSSAVSCDLAKMKSIKAIQDVPTFFESIFRYAENFAEHNPTNDPTWGFSDEQGIKLAGSGLKHLLLSLVPKALRDDVARAAFFAAADLSSK